MYTLPNTGEIITIGGFMIGLDVFSYFGFCLVGLGVFRLVRFYIKERTYKI